MSGFLGLLLPGDLDQAVALESANVDGVAQYDLKQRKDVQVVKLDFRPSV